MKSITTGIFFFMVLLLQTSCNGKQDQREKDKAAHLLLRGDWVTKDFGNERFKSLRVVFSFDDSLCAAISPFASRSRFKVYNDSLYIWDADRQRCQKWKIATANQNVLRLVPLDDDTKTTIAYLLGKNEQEAKRFSDTLTFRKIKQKNYIVPSKISFFTDWQMQGIEIDSSGGIVQARLTIHESESGEKSTISGKDYRELVRLIHSLPLAALKQNYTANTMCNSTCSIAIKYGNTWKTCTVYGNSDEPVELNLLMNRLWYTFEKKRKWTPDFSINVYKIKAFHVSKEYNFLRNQLIPPIITE